MELDCGGDKRGCLKVDKKATNIFLGNTHSVNSSWPNIKFAIGVTWFVGLKLHICYTLIVASVNST